MRGNRTLHRPVGCAWRHLPRGPRENVQLRGFWIITKHVQNQWERSVSKDTKIRRTGDSAKWIKHRFYLRTHTISASSFRS